MFKKILLSLVCLCLLSSLFIVNAEETAKATVEPYGEFYSLQNDQNKVAEILGVDKKDLNNIDDEYLAVNSGNTKQIRIKTEITEFSNRISNISNLSDDNITALIPDIAGIDDVKGKVIDKDGQKFIKIQLRTSDSGGEYILTQYFTVASKQSFVLSFYTDVSEDTEYIEKTFESYTSPYFNSINKDSQSNMMSYIILGAAILFLVVCIVVTVTIVIDLKKKNVE